MTQSIGDISARIMAEQATGCAQTKKGLGKYYINEALHVPPRSAYKLLKSSRAQVIHCPNAGAGSYPEFFQSLGLTEFQVVEQSGSAGDWSFAVKDGEFWYPAFQTNRYPGHGFSYSINFDEPFDTFERLCQHAI